MSTWRSNNPATTPSPSPPQAGRSGSLWGRPPSLVRLPAVSALPAFLGVTGVVGERGARGRRRNGSAAHGAGREARGRRRHRETEGHCGAGRGAWTKLRVAPYAPWGGSAAPAGPGYWGRGLRSATLDDTRAERWMFVLQAVEGARYSNFLTAHGHY